MHASHQMQTTEVTEKQAPPANDRSGVLDGLRQRWPIWDNPSIAMLLGLFVIAIDFSVRFTPGAMEHWHYVLQRLYYLPIIAGGLRFGWVGGVLVAIACGASHLSNAIIADSPDARNVWDQWLEVAVFTVVGALVGTLSERERYQRQHVQRAARMSALGHLSAGLAHEIRNPLAAIEGAADILESRSSNPGGQSEFVGIIQKETRRLDKLVTDFLDFARPRPPEFRPTSVSDLIDSVFSLVSQTVARKSVSLRKAIASETPTVACDPEQIKQVLLNLVLNAVQGMPNGGEVRVEAAAMKGRAIIKVRDTGPGIPARNVDSIFDPFFTTKPTGTGLGLAVAYQIIHQHGGELLLLDNSSSGATFAFTLPAYLPRFS